MKTQNSISQLTLELYYRGLATRKETRQVEKTLLADSKVRERYEILKEHERKINQAIAHEFGHLNIQEMSPSVPQHGVNLFWGLAAVALVLLCAGIPLFFHLRNSGAVKNNAVAESTVEDATSENNTSEETRLTETIPEAAPVIKNPSVEQQNTRKRGDSNEKPKIAETPRPESASTPDNENRPKTTDLQSTDLQSTDFQSAGTEIAAVPVPATGVRMRGTDQPKDQGSSTAVPEQESNLNIPPGITFIFENMFTNRNLNFIIIPARIVFISKNAFMGNPVVSVTIGANVNVDDEAIPGNFAKAYNTHGKAAGTYTRRDNQSEDWVKE